MSALAQMGLAVAIYFVVVSVLVFAVDFRRGFVLLQALLWTGALTEVLKTAFALPRPFDADSRVLDVARDRAVRTQLCASPGAQNPNRSSTKSTSGVNAS